MDNIVCPELISRLGMNPLLAYRLRFTRSLYQPRLMLPHDGWVNGGWYESLFARRRRPTRRAIPTAREAVRVCFSGGVLHLIFAASLRGTNVCT
jgi:hypothetical protein